MWLTRLRSDAEDAVTPVLSVKVRKTYEKKRGKVMP